MASLIDQLRGADGLSAADRERLHQLIGDWQIIADLSLADLVLWVRLSGRWTAVAHVRPSTGQMAFYEDVVGSSARAGLQALFKRAAAARGIARETGVVRREDSTVREDAFPVSRANQVIAIVSRHTNLQGGRTPSRLELTYLALANALAGMVSRGEFPLGGASTGSKRGAPRVGDGVVHLDANGVVKYASPNAISAIHRLGHKGDVIGRTLVRTITQALEVNHEAVDESLAVVATGRAAWRAEVSVHGVGLSMRAIPLTEDGRRVGAIILLRDVTELRRSEVELLSKEATIREIHHRVKNNLQTVAALLRLQARRLPEGPSRGALEEAVRRVGTIAMVHETLSHGFDETVNFDEIALRGLKDVVEVASREQPIASRVVGRFGRLRAEDATAIAMILSELIQNAAEHGLRQRGGHIEISADREPGERGDILRVTITDDGEGLPSGFRPSLAGLGTRIVTSLAQDLRGRIRWENAHPGTRVTFSAQLRPVEDEVADA